MSYNTILATAPLTTQNYHLKMIGTSIGNSLIWDNGTNVGIGNTNTSYTLDVSGTGNFTGALTGTSATFSGNVGLGVTTLSSWGSVFRVLEGGDTNNQSAIAFQNSANVLYLTTNSYFDTAWKYKFTDVAGQYLIDGADHRWYTAASGTAGAALTWVQRMAITSAGLVGIGTSSPYSKLDVAGSISINGRPVIDNSSAELYIGGITGVSGRGTDIIAFYTANAEKMRITSGGSVLIGQTTNPYSHRFISSGGTLQAISAETTTAGNDCVSMWNKATSGNNIFAAFYVNSSILQVGTIDYNRVGLITRYNAVSDANLKNIIGDSDRKKSIEILNSTRIREYSWKEDETNKPQIGVIAQELYETFKGAVVEGSDSELFGTEEYKNWQVDKTAFTFHLIAGWQKHEQLIQEQQIQIQNLQEQINILAK